MCKRYSPDLSKKPHIKNWGQCDVCGGWVHLSFCTPVSVNRRGDTCTCPFCTEKLYFSGPQGSWIVCCLRLKKFRSIARGLVVFFMFHNN